MHALQPKYLKIDAALNTLFGYFLIMVLDAALKPQSKNWQKTCLMHALIPEFLGFNGASKYKGLR